MQTSARCLWLALAALAPLAACDQVDTAPRRGDGAYRYLLGMDPATGVPLVGGVHEVVVVAGERGGKAEAIDGANQPARLHPTLGEADYGRFDPDLTTGKTDWDVFASNWWPQSKNGTAWRWQPGAPQDYGDLSARDLVSPMEKYDLLVYPGQAQDVDEVVHCGYRDYVENGADCVKITRPAVTVAGPATEWELKNQGTYQQYDPESWWGHCNGWASYATTEPLGWPRRDVRVKLDGGSIRECSADEADSDACVLFKMADIEALMTELYFSDQATFSGRRCNLSPDEITRDEHGRIEQVECRDLNPASLHVAMTGLLGRGADHMVTGAQHARPAFVIDHNYDFQVWNFPLVEFELSSTEEISIERANELIGAAGSDYRFNPEAERFVRVEGTYWMVSDGVPPSQLLKPAGERTVPRHAVRLRYVLELDAAGAILGGEWLEEPGAFVDDKNAMADFMWMAVDPSGWGEGADDLGGSSDNPYVSYPIVQAILRCANEPDSCSGGEPEEPASLCADQCGEGPFTEAGAACYCDELCLTYDDCCQGYAEACSAEPEPEPEPAACQGHCGAAGPAPGSSPTCYCDSACEGYGDCCADYAATCA